MTGGGDRYWIISKIERTYYRVNGAIDSTSVHEYSNDDEYMKFSEGNEYTQNKPLFICNYPLEDYTPDFGFFSLSADGKTLTLVCSGLFACNKDREGTWEVSDYGVSGYGSSFNMQRTISYPGGRSLKVKARIYTDL